MRRMLRGVRHCMRLLGGGHLDVVVALIDEEADVDVQDVDGRTPLHEACREGRGDVVLRLVEEGADLALGDGGGVSPYVELMDGGHVGIITDLVANGLVALPDEGERAVGG